MPHAYAAQFRRWSSNRSVRVDKWPRSLLLATAPAYVTRARRTSASRQKTAMPRFGEWKSVQSVAMPSIPAPRPATLPRSASEPPALRWNSSTAPAPPAST